MKTFFRNIHLYLSLAAGLVIAVVCFTGAVLVFEKEMQMFIYPDRYLVQPASVRIPIENMMIALRKEVPEADISSVKIYGDPARTVEFNYKLEQGEQKAGIEKGKTGGMSNMAFFNPYTGQVVGMQSQRSPFFFTIFSLHRWLLAGDTGKLIVGISTSVFLFILLTGIILWWPQNKKVIKHRLTLKWDAGWKRLNHDLHIVIGFYTAIFLFIFAFTGLAWSFTWFNDGIYWITGTENVKFEPPKSLVTEAKQPVTLDKVYQLANITMPDGEFYNISLPKEEDATITVTVMPGNAAHERASNQLFIDQYSGEIASTLFFQEKNLGQRIRATFYPVHVGSIAGIPGRIIALLSCIAGFTFPFTGLILWLNRLKKKKKMNVAKTSKPIRSVARS
jgi:uncharacterized iron-regulated membrane protein